MVDRLPLAGASSKSISNGGDLRIGECIRRAGTGGEVKSFELKCASMVVDGGGWIRSSLISDKDFDLGEVFIGSIDVRFFECFFRYCRRSLRFDRVEELD